MSTEAAYLRAIMALLARQAVPPIELQRIVAPTAKSEKYRKAYNLCDGETTVSDIAKQVGLDRANLGKAIKKWEANGVIVRAPEPMHVYPLTEVLE